MGFNTIDRYRNLLEIRLSTQERKVLVSAVRAMSGKKFFVSQIRKETRIIQTNQLHAVLGRLVKKGILIKLGRAEYDFIDAALVDHIKRQCLRQY